MMDKDNQQQTVNDFEIGWIAGLIEGEGSICLHIHKRNGRSQNIRVTPRVIVTNTDKEMIEKYINILDRLNIGKWVRHTKPNNVSTLFKLNGKKTNKFKDITYVHVDGFKRLSKLLPLIAPHIAGEKKIRAELLIKFISNRIRKSELYKVARNFRYDQEDVDIMLDFLSHTNSPNIDKISRMLNEYTYGKRYKHA